MYEVIFNDGNWHEALPNEIVLAISKEEAIEIAFNKTKLNREHWKGYASEMIFPGYEMTIIKRD